MLSVAGARHNTHMQPPPSPTFRARRGFTLVEIICVVLLMAIVTGIGLFMLKGTIPAGQDRNAIALANSINAAQQAYEMRVSTALTNWTGAASDNARFQLINPYIPFASGQTLAAFTPAGYTFVFGANLDTKVSVTGPSGALSY
jgi:prepilin-type N-terminal cleavage/methylation domain-containing protein